jgi:hypothetical protein
MGLLGSPEQSQKTTFHLISCRNSKIKGYDLTRFHVDLIILHSSLVTYLFLIFNQPEVMHTHVEMENQGNSGLE